MSLDSVFADFHPAKSAGPSFICRVTHSMTDPSDCRTSEEAWLPSLHQPESTCLGDFLKLLGQPFLVDSILNYTQSTFETKVTPQAKPYQN